MVIAKSREALERTKVLSLHGMTKDAWSRFSDEGYKHYRVVEAGFKYNMMDLQAAIGIHQLERVETAWIRRKEIWDRYQEAFQGLPIGTPAEPDPDTRHAYHLYTIAINKDACGISRDEMLTLMQQAGVPLELSSSGRPAPGVISAIKPKSQITTWPVVSTSTLDGLISRWSLPARCSALSPAVS